MTLKANVGSRATAVLSQMPLGVIHALCAAGNLIRNAGTHYPQKIIAITAQQCCLVTNLNACNAGCFPLVNGLFTPFVPSKTLVYLDQISNALLRGTCAYGVALYPDFGALLAVREVPLLQETLLQPQEGATRLMGESLLEVLLHEWAAIYFARVCSITGE